MYRAITLDEVAGVVRHFPAEWIDATGHDVDPAFRSWATPLIGHVAADETAG